MPTETVSAPEFADRHIGPRRSDADTIARVIGVESLEALVDAAIPEAIRDDAGLNLPAALDEDAHLAHMRSLAAQNHPCRAMIGLGYSGTITPAVIRRNLVEDPTWYTAYTPYQPEISQGRLEALMVFQTMIADLTGLPIAGSSLLDEGTAVAEAVAMARRTTKKGACVVVDPQILPQSLAVLQTRALGLGIDIVVAPGGDGRSLVRALQDNEAFAVVVQTPGAEGRTLADAELRAIADKAHENGAKVIAAVDIMGLALMAAPAEWGADIAVGSTQRFGVPLFYGGPHAAFIACEQGLERNLPGRLVGASVDRRGTTGYRLALQTREQHIRREKATSNICTAQVLLANVAAMYAVYHGPDGISAIASAIHERARRLAGALRAAGIELESTSFFDTVTARVPGRASEVVAAAREAGIHLRRVDDDRVGISVGEDATEADLEAVARAFGASLDAEPIGELGSARGTEFLTHPVFTTYRSETAMMRYLRSLKDRDFALDKGMIPLGSCTLKLNAAAELEPISYPGFANLHPFAPASDAVGYRQLIDELCDWLAEITGYDRVSLQPNAGSQGEFAGLVAIRRYHASRGDDQRTVCLIPSSAHGTNAASAAMAGLRVVVVKSAEDGSIDLADLRAKIDQHRDHLAAIMVTYPSTHGVYEDTIAELCDLVHEAGGQVYIDGANMNALVGLGKPGHFGGDVSHLNLHKTFAIPHGGGGPGVGPLACKEHLAPFLPNSPLDPDAGPATGGAVASAPYGSPGVVSISYGYLAMMGPDGLRRATLNAVGNANYVAARLRDYYPVLYTGRGGFVGHECILDLRPITHESGVTVDDVAKRLIDYGFHAPTMSFPVAGTLMVEPTESEDLRELDRFCDAMIAIRSEIDRVIAGEWAHEDSPLANAPHTLAEVTADEWHHPYTRTEAAYPLGRQLGPIEGRGSDKYWPPVGRIDNAAGDRHLICTCPPLSAYED